VNAGEGRVGAEKPSVDACLEYPFYGVLEYTAVFFLCLTQGGFDLPEPGQGCLEFDNTASQPFHFGEEFFPGFFTFCHDFPYYKVFAGG